ncbi:lipase (class 2) domain-containing protein [Ditylenchus destructor]|uniref:Lipase (Class 2) domain-containing protein n=1 Tax=Ditylenchus destructor TaxID=166010 RepID=A0AAD4R8D7_9BILA|nr:lipase (class 2) domain-containing protein [Ditylenchus destructor]
MERKNKKKRLVASSQKSELDRSNVMDHIPFQCRIQLNSHMLHRLRSIWFIFILLAFIPNIVNGQQPKGPLSDHFLNWLIANGYEGDNFDRPDIGPSGSFGGKLTANTEIVHEPVIFIHGTGDAALHTQAPAATGWSRSIQYFLEQNYTSAELYATSWGDTWGTGNILDSYNTMHTCTYLINLRRFVEAVLAYTNSPKIDVIAHSVGVPLARKVLKGGDLIATDGNCSLGPPLTERIDTFLGIVGPNYGLCVCQLAQTVPAWCNALDGLYPGYSCEDQVGVF